MFWEGSAKDSSNAPYITISQGSVRSSNCGGLGETNATVEVFVLLDCEG